MYTNMYTCIRTVIGQYYWLTLATQDFQDGTLKIHRVIKVFSVTFHLERLAFAYTDYSVHFDCL